MLGAAEFAAEDVLHDEAMEVGAAASGGEEDVAVGGEGAGEVRSSLAGWGWAEGAVGADSQI